MRKPMLYCIRRAEYMTGIAGYTTAYVNTCA